MNFNSVPFAILFALTFALYYLPWRSASYQITILVAASLIFYAWEQPYLVLLLLFSAVVTSVASYQIVREKRRFRQRAIAVAGVGAMLIVLGFFKYDRLIYETIVGPVEAASNPAQSVLLMPLPIGISFYTFHGISLVVDTFSGKVNVQNASSQQSHLARALLYLTFFPQLIAGPIMKARDFLPQIERKRLYNVDWEATTRALIVGYFLKSVVADNLAVLTNLMSGDHSRLPSITLLALVFAYSAQIFADFAGYSLIAIGLARALGYELINNFNFPYLAQSFSEFWRRWHISLSTWLRDYLFIPLGGSRVGSLRTIINIMIVMFLGGLWHGAAWSYAIWGTAHGLALAAERPFLETRFYQSSARGIRLARTMIVVCVVSFCWLLFRLPDFLQVREYISALGANIRIFNGAETLIALLMYSSPVLVYHLAHVGVARAKSRASRVWIHAILLAGIFLNSGVPGAFIYFRF
jgi:alginate O-acetyltransferase complex protein AlgI